MGWRLTVVGQERVHKIPENVIDRDVTFLNTVDAVGANHEAMV
jgi:hypothetical protein